MGGRVRRRPARSSGSSKGSRSGRSLPGPKWRCACACAGGETSSGTASSTSSTARGYERRLPGRMLLQRSDGTFAAVEKEAGVVNKNYEIAPLLADFNGDGYLDQIRVNLAGKSRAFISKGGKNKFLKVKLASTASFIGSKVEVEMRDGARLYDWHLSGEGLCSDQEHTLIFGLGTSQIAEKVIITLPGGQIMSKDVGNQKLVSWSHDEINL